MTKDRVLTDRQTGFDFLRVLSMFLIVIGHMQSETFIEGLRITDGVGNYLFERIIGSAERLSINAFLMISAYFLVGRKFSGKRFLSTWYMVFFFNVIITLVMYLIQAVPFSLTYLIQAALPIIGRPQWYMCEYLLLLLTIPFLNRLISDFSRTALKFLLTILTVFIVGASTVFPIEYTPPMYSEYLWFVYIFLLIAYIKKYDIELMSVKWSVVLGLISYAIMLAILIGGDIIALNGGSSGNMISSVGNYYCGHYEALPAFLCALFLFNAIRKINYFKFSKLISTVAKATGVIYIIHSVPVLWRFDNFRIWENLWHISYWYERGLLPVGMLVTTIAVMGIGTILYCIWKAGLMPFLLRLKVSKKIITKLESAYLQVEADKD